MARPARPWFRRGRGWFVQLDGKQHNLNITDGNDRDGAIQAMEALLAQLKRYQPPVPSPVPLVPAAAPPPPSPRPVAEAVADYLGKLAKRAEAGKVTRGHYRNVRIILEQFAQDEAFGNVPVSRLEAEKIEQWAEDRPWSRSYQHDALCTIGGLLRVEGINLRLRKPAKESLGAVTCLTDEQFAAVIRDLTTGPGKSRDLPQLLRLLRETGARPTEGARLTVEAVDWVNACTRLKEHKTKKKTGADRVIHFNSGAMAILLEQRERRVCGFLFLTKKGNPFTPLSMAKVLGCVSKRVGFRVTAYGLGRHSFATSALANGVPDALVAELLGHRGTKMIHSHYSHLGQRAAALKAAAELASRRAG